MVMKMIYGNSNNKINGFRKWKHSLNISLNEQHVTLSVEIYEIFLLNQLFHVNKFFNFTFIVFPVVTWACLPNILFDVMWNINIILLFCFRLLSILGVAALKIFKRYGFYYFVHFVILQRQLTRLEWSSVRPTDFIHSGIFCIIDLKSCCIQLILV